VIITINNEFDEKLHINKNNDIIFCQKFEYIKYENDDDYIGLVLNAQYFNLLEYKNNYIIGIPIKIQIPLYYKLEFESIIPGLKIDYSYYKETFFNHECKFHIYNGVQFYFKIYDINLINFKNNLNFIGYINIISLFNQIKPLKTYPNIYIITNDKLYTDFLFL